MYLTPNPHADAEAYYSDMQAHQDASDAIEAEAGSALLSALAWGSGEWLGLRSIRDRMAGEVIAELAATEEGCEAITKALSTLAQEARRPVPRRPAIQSPGQLLGRAQRALDWGAHSRSSKAALRIKRITSTNARYHGQRSFTHSPPREGFFTPKQEQTCT